MEVLVVASSFADGVVMTGFTGFFEPVSSGSSDGIVVRGVVDKVVVGGFVFFARVVVGVVGTIGWKKRFSTSLAQICLKIATKENKCLE